MGERRHRSFSQFNSKTRQHSQGFSKIPGNDYLISIFYRGYLISISIHLNFYFFVKCVLIHLALGETFGETHNPYKANGACKKYLAVAQFAPSP